MHRRTDGLLSPPPFMATNVRVSCLDAALTWTDVPIGMWLSPNFTWATRGVSQFLAAKSAEYLRTLTLETALT